MKKTFEMIKTLNSIKDYISEDTYKLILTECGVNVEECNKRMMGIKKKQNLYLP